MCNRNEKLLKNIALGPYALVKIIELLGQKSELPHPSLEQPWTSEPLFEIICYMKNRERPFLLVSALSRALSHKIRTPLSVISNDLSYFKSILPAHEEIKSLERCKQISDILRECAALGRSDLAYKEVRLATLLTELFDSKALVIDQAAQLTKILGDEDRLKIALRLTQQLIGFQLNNPEVNAALKGGEKGAAVALTLSVATSPTRADPDRTHSSLTDFFLVTHNLDSPLPPLIDAVWWAHGAEIEVSPAPVFHLTLTFTELLP